MFVVSSIMFVALFAAMSGPFLNNDKDGDKNSDGDGQPVRVKTVDGDDYVGRIITWRADRSMVMRDAQGKQAVVYSCNIDNVTFAQRPKAKASGDWVIVSSDQTRLFGDIVGGDDAKLIVRHPELGDVGIPIERLAAVARRDIARRVAINRINDAVLLANGDVARGVVTEFSTNGVSIFSNGDERLLAWRVVRAVEFAQDDETPTTEPAIRLRFADGSELHAHTFAWNDGQIHATLPGGRGLDFNESSLTYAEMIGGRRVWLTDLPPTSFQSVPFFTQTWPMVLGANVRHGPLRIANKTYQRGLGLHAACRIDWRLNGEYQRLTGLIGIDDSAGHWANADVIVMLDGKAVVEFRELRRGEPPRGLDVDLKGRRTLSIKIDFGRHGAVQDRVNIVNPSLIRRQPQRP